MSDSRKQPVETLRDGNLKASIWENKRDENVMHSVQFRRTYRDQEGEFRDTDSFSGNDLLRLSRLAGQSYDTLTRLRAEYRKSAPSRDNGERDQDRNR